MNHKYSPIVLTGLLAAILKVGGTLQRPQMKIDSTASITTGGAAVATGGLSLVAKGLWNRIKAQSDICKDRKSQQ